MSLPVFWNESTYQAEGPLTGQGHSRKCTHCLLVVRGSERHTLSLAQHWIPGGQSVLCSIGRRLFYELIHIGFTRNYGP